MQLIHIMISITVYIQMSIIKLLCLAKTSIILEIFNYFCRYKFKKRLRNFQPENGRKFKNKPGCPKIVVLIKKNVDLTSILSKNFLFKHTWGPVEEKKNMSSTTNCRLRSTEKKTIRPFIIIHKLKLKMSQILRAKSLKTRRNSKEKL